MRVKFKLDSKPHSASVFEAGLVHKERYKGMWVLSYDTLIDCKYMYNIVTIIPMEFTADCFIDQALDKGYIDVSDYKTVTIEELEELSKED